MLKFFFYQIWCQKWDPKATTQWWSLGAMSKGPHWTPDATCFSLHIWRSSPVSPLQYLSSTTCVKFSEFMWTFLVHTEFRCPSRNCTGFHREDSGVWLGQTTQNCIGFSKKPPVRRKVLGRQKIMSLFKSMDSVTPSQYLCFSGELHKSYQN